MEWLEIIKVRTAGVGEQGVDKALLEQVEKGLTSPGLAGAKVFAHASVPNDLVVTLRWGTEHPQTWGSDLAHSLIQELKRYGLTDHSVWIEKFPKEKKV